MTRLNRLIYGVILFLIGTGALYGADLKNGFLGIDWGTDIAQLADFVKISDKGQVSYYRNSAQTYTVFGIEDAAVIFAFFKDKFFAAYVAVESIGVFEQVKNHISQKFGDPRTILKMQNQQTIYRWNYENTKIKLKLFEKEGRMKLGFYDSLLTAQVDQAQREIFPQIPATDLSIDSHSRQQAIDDRKLKQAMDVMGF